MLITKNKCYENVSASSLSRIKTGGNVDLLVEASDLSYLLKIISELKSINKKFIVIGAGSNIIFSDENFNGAVIRLGGDFNEVLVEGTTVSCGAGVFLPRAGYLLAKRGYSGFEFMCVIPGTIGGAVKGNAGTSSAGTMSDKFISAKVFDVEENDIKTYNFLQMEFKNRYSSLLKTNNIILNATFELNQFKKEKEYLFEKIKKIKISRLNKQPKEFNTFGSTFKNNNKKSSGWYLDKVGMKEFKHGGAMVSPLHANWIVNIGNARSDDIKKIISIGQKRVYEAYGVSLEREVIYLPEEME